MCGFVGFTGVVDDRRDVIERMAGRIIHRGPDSDGFFFSPDNSSSSITLGFRRLSIIDINEGDQPMKNEDGSVVVVFNGEIYNFKELREQLISAGHIFKTNSDTETIVHGYEEYGSSLVHKLRGMFAFAIYDSKKHSLFCARDHFGIKPFYYAKNEQGNLIFGSEIKSFLEHPNFEAKFNSECLLSYLTLQYNALDETFFKNVFKLPAGHTLTFSNGKLTTERYFDIDFSKQTSSNFDMCAEELGEVVRESVDAHAISDVEVGSYLSGGIDSSFVTSLQRPNKTFSVGFAQNDFDETQDARELSQILGLENHDIHVGAKDCLAKVEEIQYHMDEVDANLSAMPLFYLSKLASKFVKVVQSGEGADEIFAGYDWYVDSSMMRTYKHLPKALRFNIAHFSSKLPYFKGQGFLAHGSGQPEDYFIGQALVFEPKDASLVIKNKHKCGPQVRDITDAIYSKVRDLPELSKKQYLDFHMWLPGDILLKADKMSMAHSLELRVPFLDKKVVEFAQRIPEEYRVREGESKAILRKASCGYLPEEWVTRKKKGFPVPIADWLREDDYYNEAKKELTSDVACEYFNVDLLLKLLDEHKNKVKNNQRKVWTVLAFLKWHHVFLDGGHKRFVL